MKRVLSFLLAMMLIFSMIPNVFAQTATEGDDTYEMNVTPDLQESESQFVAEGSCGENLTWTLDKEGTLIITGEGAMNDFESYHAPWSEYNEQVQSISIDPKVTTIGDSAFFFLPNISSVTIPDAVTRIGVSAFESCYGLRSVTVPAGVTEIGRDAFADCICLGGIWVNENNAVYSSDDCGVLFNKDKTLLIQAPGDLVATYTIPATVTDIGNFAFEYCYVSKVTFPNGLKTIGRNAFNGCVNLTSVALPDSVTEIGYKSFSNMECLSQLTISSGLTIIPEAAFYGNPWLTSVTIPEGVQTIGPAAFAGCTGLAQVTIPVSVTTIDGYAFAVPAITDVYYAGTQAQWDAIAIGEENTYLINATLHVFEPPVAPDAADYEYKVENGVATITGYTGEGGNLTIPAYLDGYRVVAIGQGAFRDNWDITSVVLPEGILTIGQSAFWDCRNLKAVNIPNGVTTIGDFAFYRCESLAAVTIPDSVTAIGDYAFQMCWSLTEITIPGSVQQMYEGVFQDCKALQTVVIEEGVPAICAVMFAACKSLKSITIPESVTAIKYMAFAGCDSLTDIYYAGIKAQWDAIAINEDNSGLDGATIHYAGHTHEYSKKVTKPTCTAKGYTTYTCECGDSYQNNYVNAKGHTYSKGKCTACGHKPAGAKITTQPKNVAVKSGKTAKVTIKATGDGLKYTWYYAKKGSSKYTKVSGSSSSYSVKMSSSVNGRKVYCVVTDKYGNSVKSSTVTLYKGTPAKITTQPKGITVANGKTGKLTIKASGSSLKYQWYVKYKGASSFTKVGKSSKTYSFKMASKLDGAQAYCVVKDKYGIEVKSSVVTIKLAAKPKVTTQPKSVLQVSGKKVKFTVKASGEGLKYQWYYAKKGSSSFKKISGAKSATYSVKVSSSVNGRKYYCLVTDKYGQTVKSSQATLTLKTVAKITTQPKNVTVKSGKIAKFTVKAVGDGVDYVWFVRWPNSEWELLTWSTNTISLKTTKDMNGLLFMCCAVDKYENVAMSKEVKLKVK